MCVCVSACRCVYVCLLVHVCTYVCMYMCVRMSACTCVYVCLLVHVCTCVCLYMCVRMSACTCVYVCLHVHVCTYVCLYMCVRVSACTCVYVCLHVHVCHNVCVHTCIQNILYLSISSQTLMSVQTPPSTTVTKAGVRMWRALTSACVGRVRWSMTALGCAEPWTMTGHTVRTSQTQRPASCVSVWWVCVCACVRVCVCVCVHMWANLPGSIGVIVSHSCLPPFLAHSGRRRRRRKEARS